MTFQCLHQGALSVFHVQAVGWKCKWIQEYALAAKRKCAVEVRSDFQWSVMKAPTSMKHLRESEKADFISTSSMESKLTGDGPGHSEGWGVGVCRLTVTLTEHLVTV